MPRRPYREQRKRIFVAIEGKDGVAFLTWMQKLIDERKIPIHIDRYRAEGGGYEKMLESAVRKRKDGLKKGNYPVGSFLIVDLVL